jgi:hypothetical protein
MTTPIIFWRYQSLQFLGTFRKYFFQNTAGQTLTSFGVGFGIYGTKAAEIELLQFDLCFSLIRILGL